MLQVANLSFQYVAKKNVLKNIHFTLKKGEHLCVMGESGCGKSTLLKLIYGLLDATEGTIFWDETPILGPKFHLVPGMDFFKYVAQDFDLMPYTSVSENIKKFLSRFHPEESEKRTQELLEVIEMKAFENTKVKNLSGGQKQRVAIARALANEPELILLDEPFGQIDNFKKNSLRRKLFHYLKEKNIACIVATHDKEDALSFAEFLMVIKDHEIIAFDTPIAIYKNPSQKYIVTLFDDVNEINIHQKEHLVYPHQLKIVENSLHKAIVLNSYFRGNYWLIEADFESKKVFLNHPSEIKKSTEIKLSFEF
ncbi:MAG: ABC transporter ATP-binding protein [Polaribacter sp.]|nr:ABC transporter ATP-binding protein [Polaribacter sp.]